MAESLGLKISPEDIKKRKEGILAIESLKQDNNSSILEQLLNQITMLVENYSQERERIEEQFKNLVEKNSRLKIKPVKTRDGKTVMQVQSDVDDDIKKKGFRKNESV